MFRKSFGRLAAGGTVQYARTAGGGHCNLDKAAAVSILEMATVGWREAERPDRIGVQAEGGGQGRKALVLACRGRREWGKEGTKRGTKKPETTKEHPRNMLATSLQLWGWSGGATVLAGRGVRVGAGRLAGLPGGCGGGGLVRGTGIPRRRAWRGASGRQHHCSRAEEPERRIDPAGGRVGPGLPDESGVPVVVSGSAFRLVEDCTASGPAYANQVISLGPGSSRFWRSSHT